VVRLGGLCKVLKSPVIVSSSFKESYPGELIALGNHPAAGVDEGLDAFTLPEFTPPAEKAP